MPSHQERQEMGMPIAGAHHSLAWGLLKKFTSKEAQEGLAEIKRRDEEAEEANDKTLFM